MKLQADYRKDHPLGKHTGLYPTGTGSMKPAFNNKLHPEVVTYENGMVCKEGGKNVNKVCMTPENWNLFNHAENFKDPNNPVNLQYASDTGKRDYTKLEDWNQWSNFNEEECGVLDSMASGDYTWWTKNGYDVDTRINASKGSQGMTQFPIKLPKDKKGREKLGPAAYHLQYNWNKASGKCDRNLTTSAWFRDALIDGKDLGANVINEIEAKKHDYLKGLPVNSGNQALNDFFFVAGKGIDQADQIARDCMYDSALDRSNCSFAQAATELGQDFEDVVDASTNAINSFSKWLPLIVVGGVIVVVVLFRKGGIGKTVKAAV